MPNIVRTINETAMENTYYITNDEYMLIVDPGSNTEKIFRKIEELDKIPFAILLTHTHYDHIMSVEAIREAYPGIPVYVSPKEAEWLGNPELNLSGKNRHSDIANIIVQPAEFTFEAHKEYDLGGMKFTVVETPGHSIGGVSFVFDDFVITGDALFKGSIGRWDLYTGDHQMLVDAIQRELFTLDSDIKVYPGHGVSTTIGHEKLYNPHFN